MFKWCRPVLPLSTQNTQNPGRLIKECCVFKQSMYLWSLLSILTHFSFQPTMPVTPLPAVIQAEERQCTKILQNTHWTLKGTFVSVKLESRFAWQTFKTERTQYTLHVCIFYLLPVHVHNVLPLILFDRILWVTPRLPLLEWESKSCLCCLDTKSHCKGDICVSYTKVKCWGKSMAN